jgi:hypothetical protein
VYELDHKVSETKMVEYIAISPPVEYAAIAPPKELPPTAISFLNEQPQAVRLTVAEKDRTLPEGAEKFKNVL